jgi:hypothetical protein
LVSHSQGQASGHGWFGIPWLPLLWFPVNSAATSHAVLRPITPSVGFLQQYFMDAKFPGLCKKKNLIAQCLIYGRGKGQ